MNPKSLLLAALWSLVMFPLALHADATWVYAVEMWAEVHRDPATIRLRWEPDTFGANKYSIFRKRRGEQNWQHLADLAGGAVAYPDRQVAVGQTYEYQVTKESTLGYPGFGYLYAGIDAPLVDQHGKVLLIVDNKFSQDLAAELNRLELDLVGDGWVVVRREVNRQDTPASVKNIILAEYRSDPQQVKAVFLFGHVPILRSGYLNVDGHESRPMPADTYYGDVDGWWDNASYLPSDVDLMVGRVDLWNMPGDGASVRWPAEGELLRNYLSKDHLWRHKQIQVPRRALMGNRFGDFNGEAFAASGFRSFYPLVGGDTIVANELNDAPGAERWSSMLGAGRYLWAYGCGGGSYSSMSGLGTHGTYGDVWSTDLVGQDAKAVFVMMFGSWLGEWDTRDNIMRAVLATPSVGLTACWSGRPHWFFHHMALGEPVGYSARVSMNNDGLYRNQINRATRGVHLALMGDPTLRMHPVAPVPWVVAKHLSDSVEVAWGHSPDASVGYHVYRSAARKGPFTRLTSSPVAGTVFYDRGTVETPATYMLRAMTLESTPSGTYYNASQGISATLAVREPAGPVVDTVPPQVWLTAPSANTVVGGANVLVQCNALDNTAVVGVEFRINGQSWGSSQTAPPYQVRWDTRAFADGVHRLTAVAWDSAGNRATALTTRVMVSNSGSRVERPWIDDALPYGARLGSDGGDVWKWVTAPCVSGARAHRSVAAPGYHQHYFYGAEKTLNVNPGDSLFVYLYLDPVKPPTQVMVQWFDGYTWEHRAYWGKSANQYGVEGTASRMRMGPLPPTGRWVRLEVPASRVDLEGRRLTGMAFTLFNGRATWDRAGKLVWAPASN